MLLHSGTPSRGDAAPPEFPQHTLSVATTGLRMLNHMATLDLDMMQVTQYKKKKKRKKKKYPLTIHVYYKIPYALEQINLVMCVHSI